MIKTIKRYSDGNIKFAMKGIGNMKDLNGSECFMIDEFVITLKDKINVFSKQKEKHYRNWMDANDEFEKLLKGVINE